MAEKRNDKVFIFAGRATQHLASEVAKKFGTQLGESAVYQYADGEFQPEYKESIRGGIVFIIQSTIPPTDNLFELLMMVDAARRASAEKVIAVIPYYGFARQDRKDKPHVPIASKLIADMLQVSGVDRVVTMDLHADQIQGFFRLPLDHLFGSSIFMPYLRSLDVPTEDLVMASPDMGGSKRAAKYAEILGTSFVICYKHRNKPNEISEMRVLGDVKDKHVVIVDDLVDTGTTLCKAAQMLKDHGAKSVRAMATHAVLSGNAIEKIENSVMEELVVTDTIPLKRESNKVHVLSCDALIAEALHRIIDHTSINDLYEESLRSKRGVKHEIGGEN